MTITDVRSDVRRALDEVTLSGQMVLTDTNMEDVASSNFSDDDIDDRIMDALRYVAARVKASHLPGLVVDVTPAQVSAGSVKFLRLLGSRVVSNSNLATRRTFASHRKLESSGRAASNAHPVFIYEDAELAVYADAVDNAATAKAVRVPDAENDVTLVSDKFRAALVQCAVSSCFQTLRQAELATAAKKQLYTELAPYVLPIIRPQDQGKA